MRRGDSVRQKREGEASRGERTREEGGDNELREDKRRGEDRRTAGELESVDGVIRRCVREREVARKLI